MCGIAGIFGKSVDEFTSQDALWRMILSIQNRGPDGQKVHLQPGLGFAHARLSIIDISERSDQPMVDTETGCIITFNGEIYNYLELRDELLAKGYTFKTDGDTEVILKAYDVWGIECLNRFNGMWAFALYDPRNQTLFCARDRFGVKPFAYANTGETFIFSSEAKSILAGFPELGTPHLEFLQHFVSVGDFANSDATFYRSVNNLLPGHYLLVRDGQVSPQKRYWNYKPGVVGTVRSFEDCLEEFQYLLNDSIRLRFRSDVPVGACLSGGLDSSSVVALASTMFNKTVSTFSCVYPEHPEIDESYYIRQTTQKFGCDAYETQPRFTNFLDLMRKSIWEQDGPSGSASILSQRAVMEFAKQHVTVILDGQGADEVLGGYHSYFRLSLQALWREFASSYSPSALWNFWQARQAIVARTGTQHLPTFKQLRRGVRKPAEFSRVRFGRTALDDFSPLANDDLTTRLMEDLLLTMSNLLHYEDRNSMAFALESRLPFLDYRIIELLFSLPHQMKIQKSRTKVLLFETVKDLLPKEVAYRKDKLGFATPGQTWFRDAEAYGFLDQYLKKPPEPLKGIPANQMGNLQQNWKDCLAGNPISAGHEANLWRYFTACMWLHGEVDKPAYITNPQLARSVASQTSGSAR